MLYYNRSRSFCQKNLFYSNITVITKTVKENIVGKNLYVYTLGQRDGLLTNFSHQEETYAQ